MEPIGSSEMLAHISELVSLARELGKLEGQGLVPDDSKLQETELKFRTKRGVCEGLFLRDFAPKQLVYPKLKGAADGVRQALDNLQNLIDDKIKPRDLCAPE